MTERVPLIATDPLTKSEGSVAPVASPISQSPATCVFQVTGPALLAIKIRLNKNYILYIYKLIINFYIYL